jgi:hypothetical protein
MKKQILSLALVALLSLTVQSCKKEEPKPTEEELTLGNKVDSLTTDIKEVKDTAVTKVEDAAKDVKEATEKGAKKVEAAAKAAKDGTVKTAKDVNDALKK